MELNDPILADRRCTPAAQFSMRTLLASFPSKRKISNTGGLKRFLEQQETAVVAHEWVHFLQATSTATGIVGFVGFLETLQLKLVLLSNLLKDKKGEVVYTPLARSEQKLSLEAQVLLQEYLSQSKADVIQFAYVDPQPPDFAEFSYTHEFPLVFTGLDWRAPTQAGNEIPFANTLPFYPLPPTKKFPQGRLRLVGNYHLFESAAFAIDMIRARLDPSSRRTKAKLGPYRGSPSFAKRLFDPYLICNQLMTAILGPDRETSLEDLYLVIDLCLQLDPAVVNWNEIRKIEGWEKRAERIQHHRSNSPAPILQFVQLCCEFRDHYDSIPRMGFGYHKYDPTLFQKALLSRYLPQLDHETITENALLFVEDVFVSKELFVGVLPDDLRNFLLRVFTNSLGYRRDVEKGSSIIEDLAAGDSHLRDLFLRSVPGIIAGSEVSSIAPSSIPGEGIAVRLSNLDMIDEVATALLHGYAGCSRDRGTMRTCAAKKISLCKELPASGLWRRENHEPHCVMEQTLFVLLESFGLEGVF